VARANGSLVVVPQNVQALFEQVAREEEDGSEIASPALPAFLHGLVGDLESADAFELDARLRLEPVCTPTTSTSGPTEATTPTRT
jgi:hypothetical protein